MTIRPKIKEICENVDEFEFDAEIGRKIILKYKKIQTYITGKEGEIFLTIDCQEIFLNNKEKEYLFKIFEDKTHKEFEKEEQRKITKQNDLLNSINFNKKENNEN